MTIGVLLVDDSQRFLEAARKFINTVPNLAIVGAVAAGLDSLRLARELQPDLVLMDIKIAGGNGIEAVRSIKQLQPSPRVILLAMHDTPEYRAAGAAVGVDGFVSKSNFGTQLLPEIFRLFEPTGQDVAALLPD